MCSHWLIQFLLTVLCCGVKGQWKGRGIRVLLDPGRQWRWGTRLSGGWSCSDWCYSLILGRWVLTALFGHLIIVYLLHVLLAYHVVWCNAAWGILDCFIIRQVLWSSYIIERYWIPKVLQNKVNNCHVSCYNVLSTSLATAVQTDTILTLQYLHLYSISFFLYLSSATIWGFWATFENLNLKVSMDIVEGVHYSWNLNSCKARCGPFVKYIELAKNTNHAGYASMSNLLNKHSHVHSQVLLMWYWWKDL